MNNETKNRPRENYAAASRMDIGLQSRSKDVAQNNANKLANIGSNNSSNVSNENDWRVAA